MTKSLVIASALLAAPAAFANTVQTHHCDINGTEVAKTKAQCKAAKGTWKKGAPTQAAPAGK